MKVIKHGKEYITEVECENCGCVYQFEYADIEHQSIYPEREILQYVICPECGFKHTINPPKGFIINIKRIYDE